MNDPDPDFDLAKNTAIERINNGSSESLAKAILESRHIRRTIRLNIQRGVCCV